MYIVYIHVYLGSKEASATTGSTGGAGATSSGTGGGKQIANTKTWVVCVCVCVCVCVGYVLVASACVVRLAALAFLRQTFQVLWNYYLINVYIIVC